jgi:hypothetical protein
MHAATYHSKDDSPLRAALDTTVNVEAMSRKVKELSEALISSAQVIGSLLQREEKR